MIEKNIWICTSGLTSPLKRERINKGKRKENTRKTESLWSINLMEPDSEESVV